MDQLTLTGNGLNVKTLSVTLMENSGLVCTLKLSIFTNLQTKIIYNVILGKTQIMIFKKNHFHQTHVT